MAKKVMVVDDSNLMVVIIKKFIHSHDAEIVVIEVHSGEESVEKYKTEKPNLVFMDIVMPGMDGITALQEIKKIDPDAKIVMCTSLKEPIQEETAKKAGCVGYIMKPFNRQDIVDVVKTQI